MLTIGKSDSFERKYMARFRNLAADHGEIVKYERDRAGRDIGLHLTRELSTGNEQVSASFCWFQMKGVMQTTLSRESFNSLKDLRIQMKVKDLQFWYLQPTATYLALYIECLDKFFVLNLKEYVNLRWGNKIFSMQQKHVTVSIPKESKLDNQAFSLILKKGEIEAWKKITAMDDDTARFLWRDYNLIHTMGCSEIQGYRYYFVFKKAFSKLRSEVYLYKGEDEEDENWICLRQHFQFMVDVSEIAFMYPYLEFFALDDDSEDVFEEENSTELLLPSGEVVFGKEVQGGEWIEYTLGCRLNNLGKDMHQWIQTLVEFGLLEIKERETEEFLDVAPWHCRSV